MEGKAGLRIAYSNQKPHPNKNLKTMGTPKILKNQTWSYWNLHTRIFKNHNIILNRWHYRAMGIIFVEESCTTTDQWSHLQTVAQKFKIIQVRKVVFNLFAYLKIFFRWSLLCITIIILTLDNLYPLWPLSISSVSELSHLFCVQERTCYVTLRFRIFMLTTLLHSFASNSYSGYVL